MPRFAVDRLTGYATAALRPFGVGDGDAQVVAESMVDADLEGHTTYGIARVPALVARLRTGHIDPRAELRTSGDRLAVVLLDAGRAFGQLAGAMAADLAVERARQTGIGLVAVRCRNEPGAVGFYLRRLAAEGMVGLAFTSSPSNPTAGSSLIGAAVPVAGRPVVLDVAVNRLGGGHVLNATPPLDAHALSPEGHGGVATALAPPAPNWIGMERAAMLALLVGMLSGAHPGDGGDEAGHVFVAIDPVAVPGFGGNVDRLMGERASRDRRQRERERRLAEGIDVSEEVVATLLSATGRPL